MERFRPYTLSEGAFLVKLARKAVEHYLKTGKLLEPPSDTPAKMLSDNYGVFTTIEKVSNSERILRGCIGYPRGFKNVVTAVISSAVAAATEDPRFPPLSLDELKEVVFEVSVLSPFELIKAANPRDIPKMIKVGVHGIMIEKGFFSGLLLPQVAVEYNWDEETFLCEACMKAWLPPDAWLDRDTKIYVFQAQVFQEREPLGEVVERDLVQELAKKRGEKC